MSPTHAHTHTHTQLLQLISYNESHTINSQYDRHHYLYSHKRSGSCGHVVW